MFLYLLISEPSTVEGSGLYPNEKLAQRALVEAYLKDPSKSYIIKKVVTYGTIVLDQNKLPTPEVISTLPQELNEWFIHNPKKVIDPRRNTPNDKQK
jgi:hypothetical protein